MFDFDVKVKAAELRGIKGWINSKPLSLEELKGKVVLVDFWTYTCINCLRSLPYLKRWHEKYAKKGLVIIGVHSPEFTFEKDVENVKKAVKELGIEYPVALDSDMKTWHAYDNHYWPAKFIIDREGFVQFVHFGEGNYAQTEMVLQILLGTKMKPEKEEHLSYMFDQSRETYTGFTRNFGLGSGLACDDKGCNIYIDPGDHASNIIYPHGQWTQESEYLELKKTPGKLSYRFNAREVNMIMEPLGKAKADIFINEKKTRTIEIDAPGMYTIFTDKKYGERELSVIFHGKVRVYAYTFG